VLLIDCDLRRGQLHRFCRADRHPGVSDVVSGSLEVAQAVRTTSNPNLDFLPTGRIPPNPADLLASNAFEQLLAWATRRYAFVVIDTPPVLAVTDAAVVARLAGVTLLVLRAGQHSIREIGVTLKRLAQNGVKVSGAVLNDVRASHGRYGKYGRHQHYEYRSKSDA
jgi:tyrosine-protein kinase Etk/Wzc